MAFFFPLSWEIGEIVETSQIYWQIQHSKECPKSSIIKTFSHWKSYPLGTLYSWVQHNKTNAMQKWDMPLVGFITRSLYLAFIEMDNQRIVNCEWECLINYSLCLRSNIKLSGVTDKSHNFFSAWSHFFFLSTNLKFQPWVCSLV